MPGVLIGRGPTEANPQASSLTAGTDTGARWPHPREGLEPAEARTGKEGPRTFKPSKGVWPC